MPAAHVGCDDARCVEFSINSGAGKLLAAFESALDDVTGLSQDDVIQPDLPIDVLCASDDARRQKVDYPASIFCRDEMNRAAHGPCAKDGAVGAGLFDAGLGCALQALANGPERGGQILSLNC